MAPNQRGLIWLLFNVLRQLLFQHGPMVTSMVDCVVHTDFFLFYLVLFLCCLVIAFVFLGTGCYLFQSILKYSKSDLLEKY